MHPAVRISEIGTYLRCPRLVYFGDKVPGPIASQRHLLLRGLMLSLSCDTSCDVRFGARSGESSCKSPSGASDISSGMLSDKSSDTSSIASPGTSCNGCMEARLRSELDKLVIELPVIYPGEISPESECLISARDEVSQLIPLMARGLSTGIERLLPCELDLDLRSEKLGLSGRLDRFIIQDQIPSIIRTGAAPEKGVWKKDRLLLTGYAMIIEDIQGSKVDFGLVEYPSIGELREVQIHSVDRSRILRIRDRIRMIKGGRLPDRPNEARCDLCQIQEICNTRRSLASKFF